MGPSVATLVVSCLAGLAVPASTQMPGISDAERQLFLLDLPLLLLAFALALVAVACSSLASHRLAGLFSILCLILINIGGLLSGQYGRDGVGLVGTLVLTVPLAYVVVRRESAQRLAIRHAQTERTESSLRQSEEAPK